MEKIGIIGLEDIGCFLIKRLLKNDLSITVYDSDVNKIAPYMQSGIISAVSITEIISDSTFIIICCTDEEKVKDLFIRDDGVNDNIKVGSVVVVLSAFSPTSIRKIGSYLEEKGADVIDVYINNIEEDMLSIIVGGKEEVFNRCLPTLKLIGGEIFHIGDLGSSYVFKAINMMMIGANLIAASEILGLGIRAGLNRKKILDVINVSSGGNFITQHILPRSYEFNFTLDYFLKQIRTCSQTAHEMELPALVTTRIEEIFAMACYKGMWADDGLEIIKFIENLIGLEFQMWD